MNTGEDEPTSGLNGRLRPRKSNSNSQLNRIGRNSEGKNFQDKPRKTLCKESPNKTDDLVNKSDNVIPQFLCPFCDKTFISKQTASKHALRIHISSSKQDFLIDCLFCNHAESESSNIIRHMVDSHPNQYFACLDCHTRFPSTSDLAEHKLNVCEKLKLPYRSKLRQKSLESKKNKTSPDSDTKESYHCENKDFPSSFNGIVISCELKPTQVHDGADIEDNITTNLILPSGKRIGHNVIDKNAIIVLDDIQWNKRIPSNFSFHNTDTDQILSRLGVVHRSPRASESTKKDWPKTIHDANQKFEKCFDTSFYTKVASNVQENLSKYLDGTFNTNRDPDLIIKTRKSKNCVVINTAEGFPILLAREQYSRTIFDGYLPRALAPRHKWKWESSENDKLVINSCQMKRDSHLKKCIITYVSNLDIWTQLSMRKKFEDQFVSKPLEKKTEKQNIISKELKEIIESREIPMTSSQSLKYTEKPASENFDFPAMLGLTPNTKPYELQPAVLSGEWVRPRCYVCCACGEQTRDSRALSVHISTQHPNAQVQHYEIVGEPLLNADILKHLYVPPSQSSNRTRPLRGLRECTKCKKPISLEDLHQHMLDCAGDTPTVRRKCRYRPFGVRKRRPRLPDNRIRKKMRKDIRSGHTNNKNHMRPRPKIRSEVGDAETIRKMLADLPAKRHRSAINPLNSSSRKKGDLKRSSLIMKKGSKHQNFNVLQESSPSKPRKYAVANDEDDDDDDNLPLRPKTNDAIKKNYRQKESLSKKAAKNKVKRSSNDKNFNDDKTNSCSVDCTDSIEPDKISITNNSNPVNINANSFNVREHSNRGGSNNRDGQRPSSSGQNANSQNSITPTQNAPLKHSIARLTADSETHDKAVQFHRLFLIQQECNNVDERHLPSDRRVLFENEAVVTKLDKPPLHFNQRGLFDLQNHRKNKLSKQRKGLNDCIAMLKNKLVPNSDATIPGHVSVQCGTDDPIEQEPIIMEPRLGLIDSNLDFTDRSILLPQISLQENQQEKKCNEHVESCKPDYTNSTSEIISDLHDEKFVSDTEFKETTKDKQIDVLPKTNENLPENDTCLTEILPLPQPRNTVIKKSPKTTVNCQIQQEEINMKPASIIMERADNIDSSTRLTDFQISDALVSSNISEIETEFNRGQTLVETSLLNKVGECEIECYQSQHIEVEQNVMASKVNQEFSPDDLSSVIPPAHASTKVESIISTPLDLSGKNLHLSTQESLNRNSSFMMNNYDNYETLDLSNKNISVDEMLKENVIAIDKMPLDVVVDLSIRQSPQTSLQSISTTLSSTKTTFIEESRTNLVYESISENVPTDLTLKKKVESASVDSIIQRCETISYDIQDLSNRKAKRGEKIQENLKTIDYSKELPRDLSKKNVKDNLELKSDTFVPATVSVYHEMEVLRDCQTLKTFKESAVELPRDTINPVKRANEKVQSTNDESNSSNLQNHFSSIGKGTVNTNIVINKNKENEDFSKCNTITAVSQKGTSEVINSSSGSIIESPSVIVPQEQLSYVVDSSTFSSAVTTTSVADTYENNCEINKDSSTSISIYTPTETTVDTIEINEDVSVVTLSDNLSEQSLLLTDNRSTNEVRHFVAQKCNTTSGTKNENYDLVEEKIIDCDVEQDTETARKIALLPKELVEILGTMPAGHRNQLLNVLPQYVSTPVAVTTAETRPSLINDSLKRYRTPSPVKRKVLSMEYCYGDHVSENTDLATPNVNAQLDSKCHRRICLNPDSNPTCPVISPDSLQQSVILKTPIVSNDNYLPSKISEREYSSVITGDVSRTVSVLNRQSRLMSIGDIHNAIIDLTDDENIQELSEEVHVIEDDLVENITKQSYQPHHLDTSFDSPRQKGSSEQTASLRAVRIKAPSERNKHTGSEFNVQQYHNIETENIADKRKFSNECPKGTSRICDAQSENCGVEVINQSVTVSTNIIHAPPMQNLDCMEETLISFENETQQVNDSFIVNPTVILTPISLEKSIDVLQETDSENRRACSIKSMSGSLDTDVIILDVEDTNDPNIHKDLITNIRNPELNLKDRSHTEECVLTKQHEEKFVDGDEDSEDDVSLAVMVQQKQYNQSKLSSCNNNTLHTSQEITINDKKRKKRRKSKQSQFKNKLNSKEISKKYKTQSKKMDTSKNSADNINSSHSATSTVEIDRNGYYEELTQVLDSSKLYETEQLGDTYKRNIKSSRDTSRSALVDHGNQSDGVNIHSNELNNFITKTCKQITKNTRLGKGYTRKADTFSTVMDDCCTNLNSQKETDAQSKNQYSQNTEIKENQSKYKYYTSPQKEQCRESIKLPRVNEYSSPSFNENTMSMVNEINGEYRKKKCPVGCVVHNYEPIKPKQYPISVVNSKKSNSLFNLEQVEEQQGVAISTVETIPESKITSIKIKKQGNKCVPSDINKSKQVALVNEEINTTPLRRSRRGKSMFVEKKLTETNVSKLTETVETKAPLTKKQLIFSKLLLDGEKLSKLKSNSAVTKEPIVVINNVDLSPQILSSVCQNNKNTNESQQSTKQVQCTKRKKSPQLKRKFKKLRPGDDVDSSAIANCNIICENVSGKSTDKQTHAFNSDYVQEKATLNEDERITENEAQIMSLKYTEDNNQKTNFNSDLGVPVIKTNSTEKRKISCTLTSVEVERSSVSKKSKQMIESENEVKNIENVQRDKAEGFKKSKTRNNNSETKNKTCYNRSIPARRTRSKSVVVKSSTSSYDPYDIDLEEMVEKDEPSSRSLLKSNKALNKLNFVRDNEDNKNNKSETSCGLNTDSLTNDVVLMQTVTNSKDDTSDSDDSSKSDVPLKKYIEEREKKNLKLNSNDKTEVRHIVEQTATDKSEKNDNTQSENSINQQDNETNRSEQFMESFGFFSERKPRKSNLIASKKITETFNEEEIKDSDEVSDEAKEQTTSVPETETNKSNEEESNSADSSESPTKKAAKRGRKKAGGTKPLTTYCKICNKEFRRPDNYLRHQITLLHIAKLSEIEMKVKTISVCEEPNYLIAYKQHLDRLKMLSEKAKRKKSVTKPVTKMGLPSLEEILANVNKSVREQQLSRRNLSRDEELFIDCCELLKESHKPDVSNNTEQVTIISNDAEQVTVVSNNTEQVTVLSNNTEQVTVLSNNTEQVTVLSNNTEQVTVLSNNTDQVTVISNNTEQVTVVSNNTEQVTVVSNNTEQVIVVSNNTEPNLATTDTTSTPELSVTEETTIVAEATETNDENEDAINEGDVDSITAQNILESEEVRNLENDLISGLKEAAANSLTQASGSTDLQPTLTKKTLDQKEESHVLSTPLEACSSVKEAEEAVQKELVKAPSKTKKNPEIKEKMYPDIIENIDIFEDKFDKIKRKCRSQAAAAKQVQPLVEPCSSHKGKKKTEKKRGKKTAKKSHQNAIPTKGALKGFDGLKATIPTTDVNVAEVVVSSENVSKKKKTGNSRKKEENIEIKNKHLEHRVKSTQTQKIDVYEFLDNEEAELIEFRPSTLIERFKNVNSKDMPSTSKFMPETEKIDLSSESGSDGDDFVYDDYVCSDDETENSLLSCELGNGRTGSEFKKNNTQLKRKDVVEKNAVMGKIFKNNAVRTEKKTSKIKDQGKPKANLDQLFDSLLVGEPGPSSVSVKSPQTDEFFSRNHEETQRNNECTPSRKHEHLSPRKLDYFFSRKFEYGSQKKNEFSFLKRHESDFYRKYEPDSPKKNEHEFTKKDESFKKHKSASRRKNQSTSPSKYETVFPSKDEYLFSRKHDTEMSTCDSRKVYSSTSSYKTDVSPKKRDSHSKHMIFECAPSTSKQHNYTSAVVQSSSHKQDLHKYDTSLKKYESSNSKKHGEERYHSSKKYNLSSKAYLNLSPKRHKSKSSSKHNSKRIKKRISNSPISNDDNIQRYPRNKFRDESPASELDKNADSTSDCALDTVDETTSDEAGVARQRARRKCTVGKQNILAETWSSESEPDSGPPRPNSAESIVSSVGRNKRRKRERQLYSNRRGISRQMPIKRQDVESRVALFKRSISSVNSESGAAIAGGSQSYGSNNKEGSQLNSNDAGPSTSTRTSTSTTASTTSKLTKGSSGSSSLKSRRRSTAYYWSSDGEEEQEHIPQHGWIVGDSHKKLVTMLAHAKGRKRNNHDDKRHNVE
ncbi:serine-rich adhesin for platelets-like [Battus philenor]|uniref:serine-rich adhesin for platelets-like n=1 Tax=Battus philenor TaxID=42288 RepID=UPI0035CF0052